VKTGPTCQAFIKSRVDLFVSESCNVGSENNPLPWTADDWALAVFVVFIIVCFALGLAS